VAAFKLSQRSSLPLAFSAKILPGGRIQISNVRQIRRLNCYSVESDEPSTPENISDTEHRLNWTGNWDNPNDSKDVCVVDVESGIEQGNGIEAPGCPDQWDVSAVPNFPD